MDKRRKGYFFGVFFAVAFALMLLLYPEASLQGARIGLSRWWDVVLPSLLPFMIMSTLLLDTRLFAFLGSAIGKISGRLLKLPQSAAPVCLLGLVGGYPLGARLGGELYERQEISERDLLITVLVGNLAGPVFIIGAVSTGFLGDSTLAIPMLLGYYVSVLITGMLFSRVFPGKVQRKDKSPRQYPPPDFSMALIRSIDAMLRVGGCMVLASSLLAILEQTGVLAALQQPLGFLLGMAGLHPDLAKPMLQGALEMTAGCQSLAQIHASLLIKASLSAGICAFGGVSVFMQTLSLAKVRTHWLVLGKLVNAILAFICTWVLLRFSMPQAQSVFAPIAVAAPGNQWLLALVLILVTGIPLTIAALYAHLSVQAPRMPKQKQRQQK